MPTILIVDDSAVDRQLFERILKKLDGITLVPAENGREALEKIGEWNIDLVVTDLQMPEMDGLELVQQMREDYPNVPGILVTGVGSEEIATQALAAGASGYVPKKKAVDLLLPTVQGVLDMLFVEHSLVRLYGKSTATHFEFELDNDESCFPPIVELIDKILSGMSPLDRIDRLRIGVAVEHALNNALYRGNLQIDPQQVEHDGIRGTAFKKLVEQRKDQFSDRIMHVVLDFRRDEFSCKIRDAGLGFKPRIPADVTGLSGRGLMIMHMFMDEVEYNGRGNEVTMRRSWKTASAAGGKPVGASDDLGDLLAVTQLNLGVFSALDSDYKLELTTPILLVGKSVTCHIVLKDDSVGAEHCQLVFRNGIWSFQALRDRVVLLNDKAVPRGRVMPDDRLKIGRHEYRIQYEVSEK